MSYSFFSNPDSTILSAYLAPGDSFAIFTPCSSGQTFTVKEKIEVSTGNFGTQKVFLISLYSAADGSIWAYYHPVDKNQRQLWKRGCCRIENLKKLSPAGSKQWLTV